MKRIFHENGLSITLFSLFLGSIAGQSVAGWHQYNEDQSRHNQPATGYADYLTSGHFIESVFENWESEFLQMGVYVVLTVFLFQKGSSESKDPGRIERVDVVPRRSREIRDAPWPVRRGGWVLRLYENSLGLAFLFLFVVSLALHAKGGAEEYNQMQQEHGSGDRITVLHYMGTSRFWFESLQNWQSEFLSIGAMVVLSIWLRQKGSPESKAVDSPHSETGKN
jgi:hypothetical protein